MPERHVYHWKHGWIPLTHEAALSKAHGSKHGAEGVAAKYGVGSHEGHMRANDGHPSAPSGEHNYYEAADRAHAASDHAETVNTQESHRAAQQAHDHAGSLAWHSGSGDEEFQHAHHDSVAAYHRNVANRMSRDHADAKAPSLGSVIRDAVAGKRSGPARFRAEKSTHLPEGAANTHHVYDYHSGQIARDENGRLAYFRTREEARGFAGRMNEAHARGAAPSPADQQATWERRLAGMDAARTGGNPPTLGSVMHAAVSKRRRR